MRKRYIYNHPKLRLFFDILIFSFFIVSIFLFSWAYRQGFFYAERWYLSNCICKKKAPLVEYPFDIFRIITPETTNLSDILSESDNIG